MHGIPSMTVSRAKYAREGSELERVGPREDFRLRLPESSFAPHELAVVQQELPEELVALMDLPPAAAFRIQRLDVIL